MEKVMIGRIVNAVGLKGEVKVYNYSDYKERFEEIEEILIEKNHELCNMDIEGVRYFKNMVILKLKGVDDRTSAEALKERDIYIPMEDIRVLPEDTYYIWDLVGCTVINLDTGEPAGKIKDVLQNSAHDIYEIEDDDGKIHLVPAVEEFVKNVDIEKKEISIKPIPGLFD